MTEWERKLKAYGKDAAIKPEEEQLKKTLLAAKKAFLDGLEAENAGFGEFLYQQSKFIKKRWWLLQALVLLLSWLTLKETESSDILQRCFGVAAPLFGMLMIPELWKNRDSRSMEIEGAAFYSLRQVYCARMLLFSLVDALLLGAFAAVSLCYVKIGAQEMLIQFFLPLTVTCCICFGTLCSKARPSEFTAVFFAVLWSAVWVLILLQEEVYRAVSVPAWNTVCALALLYLAWAVRKALQECENCWEADFLWN